MDKVAVFITLFVFKIDDNKDDKVVKMVMVDFFEMFSNMRDDERKDFTNFIDFDIHLCTIFEYFLSDKRGAENEL